MIVDCEMNFLETALEFTLNVDPDFGGWENAMIQISYNIQSLWISLPRDRFYIDFDCFTLAFETGLNGIIGYLEMGPQSIQAP